MFLAAALSLVIGLVLGTLGGGGAILTLPMLVYAVGLEPKTSIATSLFVVGTTSVVGMTVHARAGNVRWKIGGSFGLAAMAGAYGGGSLAHLIPGRVLLVLFGVIMVVTATAMLKKRGDGESAAASVPQRSAHPLSALGLGAIVGVLSGLVGAGGGFLIVPALTLFGGLAMREAIGTSLFVIALQSFAGFAGHASHVKLDWTLALAISAASVIGSVAGASLGRKISAAKLKHGFAWLVIAMGLFMFAKQLPPVPALGAGLLTLLAVLIVTRSSAHSACPRRGSVTERRPKCS